MDQKIDNRLKGCNVGGDYVGGNQTNNYYNMFQDSEREFAVTHNANIKPVAYFTGRETELNDLRQRVEEGRKSVLVSGMGGIGKTHICRKLFEEYIEKHASDESVPFQYVGYIEFDGDMGSSLQKCLKYKQQENPKLNQEAAWRELEHLASGGKLLLFVDNVDKPMREDEGLQRLNSIPGAVILTSRQTSFSDEFEPYRIGFLSTEQCIEIYEKIRFEGSERKVKPEELPNLEYIIEKLVVKHTITIDHLAHLARTKTWTVSQLREELEQKGFQLKFHKNGEPINIQEEYEKLYDLSKLTEAEQNILEAFSIFPYIPLPAKLCNQWLILDAEVNEEDDTLAGLYFKGWLQFDLEQETYAMHPVFAQFIYSKYRPEAEMHYGLIMVCKIYLKVLVREPVLESQFFLPFVESILEKINLWEDLEKAYFLFELANLYEYIGEYKKAENTYGKVAEIYENEVSKKKWKSANQYDNLANIYMKLEEYRKAEELYKKSLKISERIWGEGHPNTVSRYESLAEVYVKKEEYAKAQELLEKILRIRLWKLGEENLYTSVSYDYLAEIYEKQGEYTKAKELYEKSLHICEHELEENHPDIADCYFNLAKVYEKQSEYIKAKEMYENSLRIYEYDFEENYFSIVSCYSNLAEIYEKQGEYTKAKELYEKSIQIYIGVLGEDHPSTAIAYDNLAVLYGSQGEYKNAITYYLKAYKIFVFKLDLNHPNTKIVYENMEIAYSEWNPDGNFEQWLDERMKEE